jgi:hypothetical protein
MVKKENKILKKLRKLIPESHSSTSLAFAIQRGYKIFLTGDGAILKKAKFLEKEFGIKVFGSYIEAMNFIELGEYESPFTNYK